MKSGIDYIAAERQRQVSVEGWTLQHDRIHKHEELARAAAAYATPKRFRTNLTAHGKPRLFPFSFKWWKPALDNSERVHELAKAGALIAAEIDRLNNL